VFAIYRVHIVKIHLAVYKRDYMSPYVAISGPIIVQIKTPPSKSQVTKIERKSKSKTMPFSPPVVFILVK
jgi:hypothetical protein